MSKGLPPPPTPSLNCDSPLSYNDFVARCHDELSKPHSRLLSWEDCYLFFQNHFSALAAGSNEDLLKEAEFQLGLYLASFGMYRGSSDLLDLHRSVYGPLITALCGVAQENGVKAFTEISNPRTIESLARETKKYLEALNISATPTLVSKILMGTFGCLPSFDQNLRNAVKKLKTNPKNKGLSYVEKLSFGPIQSVPAWLHFAQKNYSFFDQAAPNFKKSDKRYPKMRVIDLYLWLCEK